MQYVDYKNYGKCAKIARGGLVCLITVDLGPRIIYYGTENFNFLNEDLERNVQKGGEYFDCEFSRGEKWYLYGGHRVWKSPEDMETYTPDNYPVEQILDEDGFGGKFVCRKAKRFVYSLCVRMNEGGVLEIENRVSNPTKSADFAVWALSVVVKGGTLRVPLNEPIDDLNPSQNIVVWPYNDLNDERVTLTHKMLTVRQTEKPEALKLGFMSKKGRAYYSVGDKTLIWQVKKPDTTDYYADFGCNFETYTNCHILEVEWLSPVYKKRNADCVVLKQRLEIVDTPEKFV